MPSFFQKLLGGKTVPAAPSVEQEVLATLAALPPCGGRVVIASPRYSGNYRCEVTMPALKLAEFVEHLNSSTFGGNFQQRVARSALPKWLRCAEAVDRTTSYLPALFFDVVSSYVGNFVADGSASVYCPDCKKVIAGVVNQARNRQQSGPWSEWTVGWKCPAGHLLYTEDHEMHVLRRRPDAQP